MIRKFLAQILSRRPRAEGPAAPPPQRFCQLVTRIFRSPPPVRDDGERDGMTSRQLEKFLAEIRSDYPKDFRKD